MNVSELHSNGERLRKDFREDGFVRIQGFLTAKEVAELNQQIKSFKEGGLQGMPTDQIYYEDINDKATLKQLQQLYQYDDYFKGLMFGSKFEKLAEVLLADAVVGMNMQYFNKPPQIGKPTPPHQDGYYFMLEPNEAVTMWLALEPVDEENGCVRYIRGSHTKGMRAHGRTETLGFSQGILDYGTREDLSEEIYFNSQPGDLLVHHSLTIHRADGNASRNRTRQAIGFIYYAASARENRRAHEAYAKQLAQDLESKNRI